MFLKLTKILLIALFLHEVCAVHIIWDKNAIMPNFNEIDFARTEEIRMPNWLFIYPGTKWCGAGNIADNYEDLGDFINTDKCCRTHDHCNDVIEGYQSAYNLTNNRFYSKLNCKCDNEFYECLKSTNTQVSNIIGNIYFNALGTECFRSDYRIVKCAKFQFAPWKKCVKYKFEETSEKLYQWFDVPIF